MPLELLNLMKKIHELYRHETYEFWYTKLQECILTYNRETGEVIDVKTAINYFVNNNLRNLRNGQNSK